MSTTAGAEKGVGQCVKHLPLQWPAPHRLTLQDAVETPPLARKWLTRRRLTVYPWMIAGGYLITAITFHVMAINQAAEGRPVMITDFNTFYAVSLLLDRLPAAQAYFGGVLHGFEKEAAQLAFGGVLNPEQVEQVGLFRWNYPPTFLLIMPLFKLVPYLWSIGLWIGVTLVPFVIAARLAIPDRIPAGGHSPGLIPAGPISVGHISVGPIPVGLALAYPTTIINGMFGQNGFLTAGLFGLGLVLLEKRPLLAGICIGLLSFKPQFGILLPIALLAGGHWRAIAAAAVTFALMAGASVLAFGVEPWSAFFSESGAMRGLMETGGVAWTMMPTSFAFVRLAGGAVTLAYGVQAVVAAVAAATVVWAWRRQDFGRKDLGRDAGQLKAAILILATLLATPFAYAYDLTLLVLPLIWLGWDMAQRGWKPWEGVLIAAAILLPLLTPILANATAVQVGPPVIGGLLALAARRLLAVDQPPAATD